MNNAINRNMLYIGASRSTYLYLKQEVASCGYELNATIESEINWDNIKSALDKYCPSLVFIKYDTSLVGAVSIVEYIRSNYIDTFVVLNHESHPAAHYCIENPIARGEIRKMIELSEKYSEAVYHYHLMEQQLPQHRENNIKRTKI